MGNETKRIAYYAVYNEADFIKQSLESVCPYVDKTIIIEGAWKETYLVNGHKRSSDGTCKILKQFVKDNPQFDIEVYWHNEDSQLEQRNALWQYVQEDCLMLLVDGDEVWEEDQIKKTFEAASDWPRSPALPAFVYTVDSWIFINDFYSVSKVRYPRLWEIEKGCEYNFVEPNRITVNGMDFDKKDLDVHYFHYSYCHSPERFEEKKRERTRLHGNFAWELRQGLVQRDDADIRPFDGEHPEVMREHPLYGVKKHTQIAKPETIVYVEHSGIGNLVLATPMLQAIRAAKPDAHIHVICWNRTRRVLEGMEGLVSVVSIEDRAWLSQFANGIDHLLISPVGAHAQVVQILTQVSKRTHQLSISAPWTQHEAEVKMQLARRLGYRGPTGLCHVPTFEYNRFAAIMAFPEYMDEECEKPTPVKWVAVNAAYLKSEHWPKKHWGDARFAEIVDLIHSEFPEIGFVFVGGKEDRGDADRIISRMMDDDKCVINRCGYSDDIKDTAMILSGCVLCIGNDGGLQHLAAAMGKPTVTIFTFTNPVKNRPFYADRTEKRGKVIMKPCVKRLMCQHGNHDACECLDVPVGPAFETACELLTEVLNGD